MFTLWDKFLRHHKDGGPGSRPGHAIGPHVCGECENNNLFEDLKSFKEHHITEHNKRVGRPKKLAAHA
jgi:hypothetical protein